MGLINKLLNFVILVVIGTIVLSFFGQRQVLSLDQIIDESQQKPQQDDQLRYDFEFTYDDIEYKVNPVANYEMWGLIVADNGFQNFFSFTKVTDAIDLKDVCILWGKNLESGQYENGKYRLGNWHCKTKLTRNDGFDPTGFAYVNLLSDDEDMRKKIKEINVGDQVHLKGYLANYASKNSAWSVKTSLVRNDEGKDGTEILFVEEIEILKQGNLKMHLLYGLGTKIILFLIGFKILFLFFAAGADVKKIRRYEESNKEDDMQEYQE